MARLLSPIVKVYDEVTGTLIFQGRAHENSTEFIEIETTRDGRSQFRCEVSDLSADIEIDHTGHC